MYKHNKINIMTQEQLRMQMLAGIITEGQYKEKLEEVDSMGKDGKETSKQQTRAINDVKILKNLLSDIQQKKIFTAKTPGQTNQRSIFVDENSQYKNLIGKKETFPILGNTSNIIEPASKAETSPDEPTFASLGEIFSALYPQRYLTYSPSSYSNTKADQIDFISSGMLVNASSPETKEFLKQNENVAPFGAVREINNNTWWIDFRYRD